MYRISFILTCVALLAGCICESGSGVLVTESRSIGSVDALRIDVPARVTLTDGKPGVLEITTDDNLIDLVTTDVRNGRLSIDTEDECCIEPTELSITLSAASVAAIHIGGSADVVIDQRLTAADVALSIDGSGSVRTNVPVVADGVELDIDGSGRMDLQVDVADLTSTIDGSGTHVLAGMATTHTIDVDGSGSVRAFELDTRATRVNIDGSGNCEVTATDELGVDIDGSGDVRYCGNPALQQRIDGSGSIATGSCSQQ